VTRAGIIGVRLASASSGCPFTGDRCKGTRDSATALATRGFRHGAGDSGLPPPWRTRRWHSLPKATCWSTKPGSDVWSGNRYRASTRGRSERVGPK